MTERRVIAFNADVVPHYLRTKPEPEVEERLQPVLNRASSLTPEMAQVCICCLSLLLSVPKIRENYLFCCWNPSHFEVNVLYLLFFLNHQIMDIMLSNVEYLNHLIYFVSNSILVLLFRIYILVSLIKIKPLTCSHLLICHSHARHINIFE